MYPASTMTDRRRRLTAMQYSLDSPRRAGPRAARVSALLSSVVVSLMMPAACGTPQQLGIEGASCVASSDCEAPLQCLANVCTNVGETGGAEDDADAEASSADDWGSTGPASSGGSATWTSTADSGPSTSTSAGDGTTVGENDGTDTGETGEEATSITDSSDSSSDDAGTGTGGDESDASGSSADAGDDEDSGGDDDGGSELCGDSDIFCHPIDLLFVLDNSGTMGQEQDKLLKNVPRIVENLLRLKTTDEKPVHVDINVMVTTSDMSHPSCKPFEPEHYDPLRGRPASSSCLERIRDFTGLGQVDPPHFPEVCEDYCADSQVVPEGGIIHFGPGGKNSNVPNDAISEALSCVLPQGVNGCGYESPLESMLQALNPAADWNDPAKTEFAFLRDEATLAIVLMTDEADCSVQSPDGYAYFTDRDDYWLEDPDAGSAKRPSSAVCWGGGVDCDGSGNCRSVEGPVLHPVQRYTDFLNGYIKSTRPDKDVLMLALVGVPEVTERNERPPYEPTAGGVHDVEYRPWRASDILPGDKSSNGNPATVERRTFELGIGPGCVGRDHDGQSTGSAVPPVRIREVCESLDERGPGGERQVRCCMESVCDDDYSGAVNCLEGMLRTIEPWR